MQKPNLPVHTNVLSTNTGNALPINESSSVVDSHGILIAYCSDWQMATHIAHVLNNFNPELFEEYEDLREHFDALTLSYKALEAKLKNDFREHIDALNLRYKALEARSKT